MDREKGVTYEISTLDTIHFFRYRFLKGNSIQHYRGVVMKKLLLGITVLAVLSMLGTTVLAGSSAPKSLCYERDTEASAGNDDTESIRYGEDCGRSCKALRYPRAAQLHSGNVDQVL